MSNKLLFTFNPKCNCFTKLVDNELINRLINGNWESQYSDLT
jgi:hypothetical protein